MSGESATRVLSESELARNKRLDALLDASKFWANKRRTEINNRVANSKKILKGRTGSERLAQSAVQAASLLVVKSLDDFLITI
jgi:hypothetical protein